MHVCKEMNNSSNKILTMTNTKFRTGLLLGWESRDAREERDSQVLKPHS